MRINSTIGLIALVAVIGMLGYVVFGGRESPAVADTADALVEITLPAALSAEATSGKALFEANCVQCHGTNAVGQNGVAPPLIHKIYEPNHHGDESFQRAAALGVRGHHWPFGDMPPVEGLSRDDVALIIHYIRELQRANGIQ